MQNRGILYFKHNTEDSKPQQTQLNTKRCHHKKYSKDNEEGVNAN